MFEPYRLIDGGGQPVVPVTDFLRNLQAAGRSEATQRSYGMDLMRWFRFTWAAGFEWDQATRTEARDFCRWLQLSGKPERDHWRTGRPAGPGSGPAPGTVNAVTGKASPGPGYAVATVAHCETVLPVVLRLSPGDRVRAAGEPVPAGQEQRPGACASQPYGAVPEEAGRAVPAAAAAAHPAEHPGPGVRRAVRVGCRRTGTGRWSRSGSPRARGPRNCCGVTGGSMDPGQPADHGDPQGVAGGAAAAGVAGRVRVAAALPGGDARPGARPGRTTRCGGRCGARSGR